MSVAIDQITMNTSLNARVIGFDFGLKRIGTAMGNTHTGYSQALSVLLASNGIPNWHEVKRLIEQWLPATLVVGMPLKMDGSEGAMARRARQFGELIEKRFEIGVVYVDERLSTADADWILQQTIAPGKSLNRKRKTTRDSIAAELIVQTYLNQQHDS